MKLTWTVDDVMELEPCWTREQVEAVFGKRKRAKALTLLRDTSIKADDPIWFAIVGVLEGEERLQRLFACDCAERALQRERDAGREPDMRSWEAVAVSRRYANGQATDEERYAAGTPQGPPQGPQGTPHGPPKTSGNWPGLSLLSKPPNQLAQCQRTTSHANRHRPPAGPRNRPERRTD